jgi:hypothetical protein
VSPYIYTFQGLFFDPNTQKLLKKKERKKSYLVIEVKNVKRNKLDASDQIY